MIQYLGKMDVQIIQQAKDKWMKSIVLQLVRDLGSPEVAMSKQQEEERIEQLILYRADQLIKRGARRGWKKTLAKELNIPYSKMLYLLQQSNIKEYSYLKEQQ